MDHSCKEVCVYDAATASMFVRPSNVSHTTQRLHYEGEPEFGLCSKKMGDYLEVALHSKCKLGVISHHGPVEVGSDVQIANVG